MRPITLILLCLSIDAGAWLCYRVGRWTARHESAALRKNLVTVAQERNTHAGALRDLGFEPGSGTFVGHTSQPSHSSHQERTTP